MSRTKKSRNPGVGSNGVVKDDKKKSLAPVPKRPKKKTGKQAGNRQQEANQTSVSTQQSAVDRDPRIGSKKPIVLSKEIKAPAAKVKKAKPSPIAAIRIVEADNSLENELAAIEEDSRLLALLAKQEDDIALEEAEVNYYNEKMERHQQISEILGLSDDEEEDELKPTQKSNSEDDLWDKLDSSTLSDFE